MATRYEQLLDLTSKETDSCILEPYSLSKGGRMLSVKVPGAAPKNCRRIVLELYSGEAPRDGLQASDTCGEYYCVNHRHLQWTERWQSRFTDAQRLWSKVDRKVHGCWEWTALNSVTKKGPGGYGQIYFRGKKTVAHRVAYILEVGPIPEGLEIDHLCRNTLCCRPDHLEPVTALENMRRANEARTVRSHCVNGHDYEVHGRVRADGNRYCTACNKAAVKEWRRRNPDAAVRRNAKRRADRARLKAN